MGHMMNGKWSNDDRIPTDARGSFVRADSQFRHWITADGGAGPSGSAGFKAEPGRYHLFVSYSCPWAHRTIIFRKLKKLENVVSMSLADKPKTEGWAYSEGITANGARSSIMNRRKSSECSIPPSARIPM